MTVTVCGSLPEIIRNDHKLYDGNLTRYFQVIFNHAQNLHHPYHNFRHMFHVMWLCYQACVFYAGELSPRQMRSLLVAALFHDFDHSGIMSNDDLNIDRAVRGFGTYIAPEDERYSGNIVAMIMSTGYHYQAASENLPLCCQILRDADLSQALNGAWIQQVVFGLAAGRSKQPIDVLKAQGAFHKSLVFNTEWARQMFSGEDIEKKIAEATELLELLETKPAAV